MTVKYDADLETKLPDLEIVRLRSELAAITAQLSEAQRILEENGLADAKPKPISAEEMICLQQIDLLAKLSAKGLPFETNDVKNLEILVKTLLAIRGKTTVADDSSSKKKKEPKQSVADLLQIVKNSPKAE